MTRTARGARMGLRAWLGGLVALAALAWLLRGLEFDRLPTLLARADLRLLALVPVAIAGEQVVRAWKWRQLLHPVRAIPTPTLFSAIMAGYLVGLFVPVAGSPFARAWLVARRAGLKVTTVLATVATDRLVDGLVFAALAIAALAAGLFPDPTGGLRNVLLLAALASLGGLLAVLAALVHVRRRGPAGGWPARAARALPGRLGVGAHRLVLSFVEGIVWPAQAWRGLAVLAAAVAMKGIAASHFLWAGLALGLVLDPGAYVALLVLLGFLVILAHAARVPGGFVLGGIFALGLMGVEEGAALAMVLAVQLSSLAVVGAFGALALWREGLAIARMKAEVAAHAGGHAG
ncbi:MAG: flippase-like domain-containing protein [Proteobacteria bacterium]|nr:flippase-like domain-containing protein [Pseudomonadota bacterium]